MCGIAGIFNINHHQLNHSAIGAMINAVEHRGPDAKGKYVDEQIAFGHRRLAIIDLNDSANQPMWDFTHRYMLVLNGEIYNYQDIKAEITDYPFQTESDTEVIIAAYLKWGPDCLKKFNGMFAFALWDTQANELFIARDRVGERQLYYFHSDKYFVFCSEIRGLLASGIVPREVEEKFLREFLMFQAPLSSHTLVKGIKQLHAGHYALIRNGIFQEHAYWQYQDVAPSNDNYKAAKKKVHDLFIDSVRLSMVADVPVGAFLSGGIDSSLVVACMSELSERPVSTFSISFAEKGFDESGFAQQIASKYKTDHHRIVIKPEEFLYSIEEIFSAMDSPSGDGHNTYLVSKHTRASGIKVALSGLGGDELFAGYHKFLLYNKIIRNKWLLMAPGIFSSAFAKIMHTTSGSHRNSKFADLLSLTKWNLATVYPELRKSFRSYEADKILSSHMTDETLENDLVAIDKATDWMGTLSKATIGEFELYTRDVLLRDTDQMAMAHALEVRVPFFDYRLIEYVLSLPDRHKFPHSPKRLLVDALKPKLPENIVNRKKMGFSFPMEKWLRNELSGITDQKLTYLADRKEFNGTVIKDYQVRFHKGDKQILWTKIWQMVVISDWLERNKL
ncbi:MAG: asparagine synthase (glutamine-hydrolyzing) [Saprospiraceae bacterium]